MDNLFANRVVMWIADQAPSIKIFSNHEDCETVEIVPATRLAVALEVLQTRSLDAILVSLPFAGCRAEELLGAIRELRSELPVIVHEPSMIRRSDAEVQRLGISRYIASAVPPYYLGQTLLDVMNNDGEKALEENRPDTRQGARMVGSSASMRQVAEVID